jgi:predicted small lipoprotein YifL
MRKPQLVALLLMIATFALTACGQKGALYITADEPAPASTATPATDAEKPKKDGEISQ